MSDNVSDRGAAGSPAGGGGKSSPSSPSSPPVGALLLLLGAAAALSSCDLTPAPGFSPLAETPPAFCALPGGRLLYTDAAGDGGRDLFVFDIESRSKRRVARTPRHYEWEVAASPDGKAALCTYLGPRGRTSAEGMFLVDLARGTTREVPGEGLSRAVGPVFSPSGRRVAFAREPATAWQSMPLRELWELDLHTGELVRIDKGSYSSVWGHAYRDEDRLYFSGDIKTGNLGEGKRVLAEYSRRDDKTRVRDLPPDAGIALMGFSPDGKTFYGLGARGRWRDTRFVRGDADRITSPETWEPGRFPPGPAELMPSRQEMLYLSQNEDYFYICRYTLADGKSKALLKVPK